jgi:hypothetical protein
MDDLKASLTYASCKLNHPVLIAWPRIAIS